MVSRTYRGHPDTDGGGLEDGEEIALGTDPLDATDDLGVYVGGCQSGSRGLTGFGAPLLATLGLRRRRR